MGGKLLPVRLQTSYDFLKFFSNFFEGDQLCVSYVALQLVSCVADVKNSNN